MHAHAHWVRPHGNKCGRIHTVRLQVLREGSRNQAPRMESIEEIDPWNVSSEIISYHYQTVHVLTYLPPPSQEVPLCP